MPIGAGAGTPIQPFKFYLPGVPPAGPAILYGNWDDDLAQVFSSNFYYSGYFGKESAVTDEGWTWTPLKPISVSDIVLMGYSGYNIPTPSKIESSIDNATLITIPVNIWDTDADQQLLRDRDIQSSIPGSTAEGSIDWEWNTLGKNFSVSDVILMSYYGYSILPNSKREYDDWEWSTVLQPVTLTNFTWDTDEYQKDFSSIWIDFKEISEYSLVIILPDFTWDDDIYQKDCSGSQIDLRETDEGVLLQLVAAITDFTWDTGEDQKAYPNTWIDFREVDEGIFPGVATPFNLLLTNLNDADQQFSNYWVFSSSDFSDEYTARGFEQILVQLGWRDNDCEQQSLQASWSLAQIEELVGVPIIPITEIDLDAEQQKLWLEYYKDHLSDEGIEKITLPIIVLVLTAFDTDSDQQLSWIPSFSQDTVFDETVEFIQLSTGSTKVFDALQDQTWPIWALDQMYERVEFILIPTVGYDTDADQQKTIPPSFSFDSVADEVVEKIIIPTVAAYEMDSDQQKATPLNFSSDSVMDEGVEIIIISPSFPVTAYDTDAEQQNFQLAYRVDIDIMNLKTDIVILPPFIDIVEITAEAEDEHDN